MLPFEAKKKKAQMPLGLTINADGLSNGRNGYTEAREKATGTEELKKTVKPLYYKQRRSFGDVSLTKLLR